MTNLQTARQIITDLKITDRERIIELMWCPLQLIYVELAKVKEIKRISDLEEGVKKRYWDEVNSKQPKVMKYRKIWIVQALYVFDLINSDGI